MQIKAAIFDMDGTLIDSLIFWEYLWKVLGTKYRDDPSFAPSAQVEKAIRTITMEEAMALLHETYGLGESAQALAREAGHHIREFYENRVELKPGVKAFLEHLQAQGVPMCIASATVPELIELAARHCGIHHYFQGFYSCADLGKGKEHPDIYLYAMAQLGTAPEDTWVFEDSLVALETAAALGMPTVAIYDANNFGHEQMARIARHYIGPGQTLEQLI